MRPPSRNTRRPPARQAFPHARSYRAAPAHPEERRLHLVLAQSDLHIIHDLPPRLEDALVREAALAALRAARGAVETAMALDPRFRASLAPLPQDSQGPAPPSLVRDMLAAGEACGVGPMAAVAGGVAEAVAWALREAGARNVLVENGGDLFCLGDRERVVGLLPHPDLPAPLGLRLPPDRLPCAVCGSSGRLGHSLSFGQADLAAVLADSGTMADAAATALGNRLRQAEDIPEALAFIQALAAPPDRLVRGAVVLCGGKLGAWGEVEFVAV